MKPVMTGQLQRGTAPATPVADDPNNKERGKLNKVQGEIPATEPTKASEVPVKFEKGGPESEK